MSKASQLLFKFNYLHIVCRWVRTKIIKKEEKLIILKIVGMLRITRFYTTTDTYKSEMQNKNVPRLLWYKSMTSSYYTTILFKTNFSHRVT